MDRLTLGPDRTFSTPIYAVHRDIERILLSEEEIRAGVERVALQVTQDFAGEEFSVVSVLKGSCVFTADLIRRLPIPLSLSFVVVESYRDGTTPGEIEERLMPSSDEIRGRRVLLVDDILDSGRTLDYVGRELLARGAKDVSSCVLLDKPARRALSFEAEYRCYEVEDVFVVGYGLDYDGRYRNLPYVGKLRSQVFEADSHADQPRGASRE